MSVKDQVLRAIHRLPDNIDHRNIADAIASLAAVREAELDINEGRFITNEQMKTRIVRWTANQSGQMGEANLETPL